MPHPPYPLPRGKGGYNVECAAHVRAIFKKRRICYGSRDVRRQSPTSVLSAVCVCRGRCPASPQADPASRLPASRTSPRLIQNAPTSVPSCLSPRERWQRVALTKRGRRRTPKAFENVPAVAMPSQSPAVTAPPKGEPRQNRTRIRAFLPLPMGEVAMPQGIDGEGRRGDNPHPIVHCPLSIIHY